MNLNYVEALVDEISLEGLDGITLQALWIRLQQRKNFDFYLDDKSKNFLWNIIKKLKNIEYYILPKSRADLAILEHGEDVETDILNFQIQMKQLYPHCIVDFDGIKGSCPTFESRKKAPKELFELSVEECQEKWRNRLVLVASQHSRAFALMGSCKKCSYTEMPANQYCILERIGRSRHYGAYTYGPGSIQDMIKEDPRSLFYVRKIFLKLEIITKQYQSLKTKSGANSCYLLHLTRFYTEVKSLAMLRQDNVLSLLRSAPEHYIETDKLKEKLNIPGTGFKKLMSAMHNKGLINSQAKVTYRTVHPDAKQSQWQSKTNNQEKTIRVVVLGCNDKVEPHQQLDEDAANSDDEDGDDQVDEGSKKGILDLSRRTLERTVMFQAYRAIEEAGPEGLTQKGVGKIIGLGKLERRLCCRQLLKEGTVALKMQDVGRQRVSRYFAVRLHTKDPKFEIEKNKFVELVGDIKILEKLLSRDVKHPHVFYQQQLKERATEVFPISANVPETSQNNNEESKGSVQVTPSNLHHEHEELDLADPLNTSDLLAPSQLPSSIEEESLMTYRILRRINIILSEVLNFKVVDDITKFYKLIQEDEKLEGYDYKLDRKSLFRLIGKLQREKCIKLFKAVIKSDDKKKTLTFVCSSDIDRDHPAIQCAIEQAKFRIFNIPEVKLANVELHKDPLLDQESIILSVQEIQKLNEEANSNANSGIKKERSNRYAHCPKFVRMRLLHKLLFYLTRSYEGRTDLNQLEAAQKLKSIDLPSNLPHLYTEALNWKMFVPPLPQHEGWHTGWTILCDVVLRIPLSIFVRIMWVRFVIPGLDEYMNHPIKQHYLLGNLPRSIRSNLLAKRKFVFTLFETVQRLCFMGLVQFGPQRLKDKDQLFVYVNTKASIMDTTTSDIGYFQVSTDRIYDIKSYSFSNIEDIDKYWCDLFTTSVCTQLGGKAGLEGKEIILENLENKPNMLEACQPRTALGVLEYDNGSIPGDHLGAAGLDSAFFAHLKRNWCSKYMVLNASVNPKESESYALEWGGELDTTALMPLTKKPKIFDGKKLDELKKLAEEKKIVEQKKSELPSTSSLKKKTTFLHIETPGRRLIKRKITERRIIKKKRSRPTAATSMNYPLSERVTWTQEEDVYMVLFKVAGIFLSQDSVKTPIKGPLVAKVLHKYIQSNSPKTGPQCLRRMAYLYNRSESAQLDIAMCLEESRLDPAIVEKYWHFQQDLRSQKVSSEVYEKSMDKAFEDLVGMLKNKYRSMPDDLIIGSFIPDTVEEFYATYEVVNPYIGLKQRGQYTEPTSLELIYFNTIITLIFSSLGTAADKTNYSFQLLNVYQQYPDKWLRAAISKLRNDQMVSSKKLFARSLRSKSNQIPLTSTPFQLAMSYYHMIQSKYQYDTFHDVWSALQSLRGAGGAGLRMDVMAESGGRTACVLEGIAVGLMSLSVNIPAQIVILDFDSTINEEEKKFLQQYYEKVIINTDKLENFSFESSMHTQPEDNDSHEEIPAKKQKIDEESTQKVGDGSVVCGVVKDQNCKSETQATNESTAMDFESIEHTELSEAVMLQTPEEIRRDKLLKSTVAARLKFYAARDELREKRGINEGRDHKARLAMKPCEVTCNYDADNLPMDEEELKRLIKVLKSRHVIEKDSCSWAEVKLEYIEAGATEIDLKTASAIVDFIIARQQLGASTKLLRETFCLGTNEMSLGAHLSILTSIPVLLRVGVCSITYVHWSFKQPWLINSSKVKRLERETLNPLDAVMLDLGEDANQSDEDDVEQTEGTENVADKVKVTKKFQKSQSLSHSIKTAEEVARQLEASCGEKVMVAIRPWVRVDGSLNRRVLDRLLGAVLCHLLYYPGCTLDSVQQRFCPALQPFHTFELIEMLSQIRCVRVLALKYEGCVTLFSKMQDCEIVPADFTEAESKIFIEPAVDAVLRMAQFIGNKNYSTDFLDDIKIRPCTEAPSNVLVT